MLARQQTTRFLRIPRAITVIAFLLQQLRSGAAKGIFIVGKQDPWHVPSHVAKPPLWYLSGHSSPHQPRAVAR